MIKITTDQSKIDLSRVVLRGSLRIILPLLIWPMFLLMKILEVLVILKN